ncbi:MAG TPA: FtsX-like permease family protein [Kofleriaceae bacterium]|nr:FtsX-like permease family protein [Kofleriaceae bacterium]
MHFIPILSSLRRHRTAATLIVLEIAVTCAIVCNAVFLVTDRVARMDRASGVAEDELVRVQIAGIGKGQSDARAITAQDLAALRTIPGVKSVANTNMVPFGRSSWNNSLSAMPDDPHAPLNVATYMGSADLVETYGVQLVAGRDFNPDEYADFEAMAQNKAKIGSIIVSRGVAEKIFPGQNALGKTVYTWGKDPLTIVGIIERIARPNEYQGSVGRDWAVFLPITMPYTLGSHYVMRVDPARKAEVLAAADATLDKVDPRRIMLEHDTFHEIRTEYFRQDRAMAYLLVGVSIALLIITALGVVGLASFWVQQRTRQIGIRRALGATRKDILRYFQTENFILASLGIVLGMGLAYGINLWLMHKYQVERLPSEFLPIGALLLWLLGQVAVLGPALRASMIPPAIATRTV